MRLDITLTHLKHLQPPATLSMVTWKAMKRYMGGSLEWLLPHTQQYLPRILTKSTFSATVHAIGVVQSPTGRPTILAYQGRPTARGTDLVNLKKYIFINIHSLLGVDDFFKKIKFFLHYK